MSRSTWAATMGLALLIILVLAGLTVPTPFIAIGRGPTYNALGAVQGVPVVAVTDKLPTYPTAPAAHLNMTTVSVTDGLSGFEVLRRWLSSDYQVEPRFLVYPPNESGDQVAQRNEQDFVDSQSDAEGAALGYLKLPETVYVEGLTSDSASQGVLQVGDTLLAVAGRPLTTFDDLTTALAATRPGQQVPVRFQRGGAAPQDGTVTLGGRPDGPQGTLGVFPAARPTDPGEITISLGNVGGPSAGLMFSLAIIDKLTPGDLTGGRFVAGTGTITSTGLVGPIDGIRYKMAAAREAGATTFLVPPGNCDEAVSERPDGLQLIKATDLTTAATALQTLNTGGTPPSCS